ncbi:tumor necrosis factor receptor superfamily member 6B-like [Leucoraja erinacea]|uniref:tumor necrosis factor receptor superfamily member 6B-like n=1 Tax=Leucoraja erinaceus TaxID=7782 RepID=UPI002457ED2E|nr:tumor necrosis factor receptor superfamily member 6B-like [Leucoraja erinacea]
MILKCLALFALTERVLSSTVVVRTKPTFEWTDPNTREKLLCEMCGPGTVVLTRCTATQQTVCRPCIGDQFMKHWNRYTKCHGCYRCVEDEHEIHPCNGTHNRVCQCDTNYFFMFEFCKRHTECTFGHGVVITGTHYRDSTCEKCPSGFFSPTHSSTDLCIAHTNCIDGLVVNVPGNLYHDTLCTSCSTYVGTTACDDALIQFLAHQKIAKRKLKKFIRSLVTTENVEQLHAEMSNGNRDMMYTKLYPLLVKWRKRVQGKHVAEMIISKLESAKLKNVVTRIKKRFGEMSAEVTFNHLP